MKDVEINVATRAEKSYAKTYRLNELIRQKKICERYFRIGRILRDGLLKERVALRSVGSLLGILAREEDELNRRLKGQGVALTSKEADTMREIFGMMILEDP